MLFPQGSLLVPFLCSRPICRPQGPDFLAWPGSLDRSAPAGASLVDVALVAGKRPGTTVVLVRNRRRDRARPASFCAALLRARPPNAKRLMAPVFHRTSMGPLPAT